MERKEAIEVIKKNYPHVNESGSQFETALRTLIPELKESEDKKIRRCISDVVKEYDWSHIYGVTKEQCFAWIERQGKQSKWKPSKDEMDALYGLAYITNKMDDKKDEAVTKLYQDLKREFFNGASYENMFPSSYIDSNINVEKQGEQTIEEVARKVKHDKEYAIAFLKSAGILNEDGQLAEEYRTEADTDKSEQNPAWSEDDETMLKRVIDFIPQCMTAHGYNEYINWLESFKERVQPQPKQDWSEEDEQTFIKSVEALEDFYKFELADWLKEHKNQCLKPQNRWKPNELQMEQLGWIAKQNKDNMIGKELMTLYQDLKKLREE